MNKKKRKITATYMRFVRRDQKKIDYIQIKFKDNTIVGKIEKIKLK